MLEEQERAKKLEDERYEQSLKERALRVRQTLFAYLVALQFATHLAHVSLFAYHTRVLTLYNFCALAGIDER